MGEKMPKQVEIEGRRFWDFGQGTLLPVVSGGDGDGGDGDGGGSGGDASSDGGSVMDFGDDGDGDDSDGDGQGSGDGSGDGQTSTTTPDLDRIVGVTRDRLIQDLEHGEAGQRIADRLVGAQGKQMKKLLEEALASKGGDGGNGDGGSKPEPKKQVVDVRQARMAFREEIGYKVGRFYGDDEREGAFSYGTALVSQLAAGDPDADPEDIGRQAAKVVATQVDKNRKMYEDRTVRGLKRRGALVETQGQPGKGGQRPGDTHDFSLGADAAKAVRPPKSAANT